MKRFFLKTIMTMIVIITKMATVPVIIPAITLVDSPPLLLLLLPVDVTIK